MLSSRKKTVLVVEDEPALRRALRDSFSREKFRVRTAGTGEEALALIEREKPDSMVLDITLPNMSGIDLLRELGGRGLLPHMPVVVLTASTDLNVRRESYQVGSFAFLVKTEVSLEEVVRRVKTLLAIA